jgi:hypothetical protein
VLKSFFVRPASGQNELDRPAELPALLRAMSRNKVTKQARNHRTLRRDVSLNNGAPPLAAAGPSSSRIAIGRLASITILPFREGLSDRPAVDAVRAPIDWRYLCSASRWPTRASTTPCSASSAPA